jgi:non-specific serine/threonine protein kinase
MAQHRSAKMTAAYSFGRFQVNPASRQLLVEGQPAALGTRAFDVLLILIERRERLVTKDELLDLAWPGVVVEENNLQVQISTLRKILGDDAIRTVAGHGYQFTAAIAQPSVWSSGELQRHNLPRPLTRFIGHEADLAEYEKIIATTRLVTLTGAGGCGKTRLAVELAARVVPKFAHGAWFVDLAPMTDAERLALTVARTLGVDERPGESIEETLCERLAGWQMLLILDNCEHIVSACASLVRTMLSRASDLAVLATSRERLDVPGECTLRVRSLSCPPAEQTDAFDRIQTFEAVQLFVDRARSANRDFALNPTTAPAVADVCRQLDGIPLAIELAAARTKVCSASELRKMLDDRFRLLVGGSRTVPPRQQTLLAAIKWSFDLLTPEEQEVLVGLSVFSGGWTLEAAVAVAGEKAGHYDVLDQLTRLVDESLIATRTSGDTTRYSMLETLRQYARDRLLQSGKEADWRDRHIAYFLALAEQAEPHLVGSEQQAWLERLETEHENLRTALTWGTDAASDINKGLRLGAALIRFWRIRGYHREGRAALAAALAVAPKTQVAGIRAKLLLGAGTLAMYQGDQTAAELFEESLALCREMGDRPGIAKALHGLGYIAVEQEDLPRARLLQEEVVAIMRELDDRADLGRALVNLGNTIFMSGDQPSGRAYLEEALGITRELRNRYDEGWTLANLGGCLREEGDLPRGLARLKEALSIFRELGDRRGAAGALLTISSITLAMKRPSDTVRLWGAAHRLITEIGWVVPSNERLRCEQELAQARTIVGESVYSQAWTEGQAATLDQAVHYAVTLPDA